MTRADRIVVLLAVALLPLLYAKLWFGGGHGHQAGIWVDNELVEMVPLEQPGQYEVTGRLGNSVLEVRDRGIRFLHSPCPGQICTRGGWLRETGATLVCLPGRITLRVLGNEPRFDAINF